MRRAVGDLPAGFVRCKGIMFDDLKKHYEELKQSRPGQRFQELHERRSDRSPRRKALMIGGGVLLMIAGVVLMVLPGPGLPLLLGGFALVAQELQVVARALDSLEVKARAGWRHLRLGWRNLRRRAAVAKR